MLVAEELRKTYFGAALLHRLFSQAQSLIVNRKTQQETSNDPQSVGMENLETSTPCPPNFPTQRCQDRTDEYIIRNLGSVFTGFEGMLGGDEYV